MRIPITKADWPGSFNSTSKYIGRHWPKGKLKLSAAREKTARLMGYNSVHDVQQELLEAIPKQFYSTQLMASSMAVKSVLMYELAPVESFRFFSSIPWTNFEVWKSTSEYKQQQLEAKGTRLFIDEYDSFMNYTTPALIASAYSEGQIPPYEFTVSKDGVMFHRATFERLLKLVEPEEQTIEECGHELSVEEYFNKHILPLAHNSVEEMITVLNPDKPEYWLTPADVHILKAVDGRYVLHNKALNGFYPGAYEPEHLREAIKRLFMLRVIPDVATECQIPTDLYGIDQEETKPYGTHGTFTFNDQVFYRRTEPKNYSEITSKPFLEYLLQKLKPTQGLKIPDSIIPASHLDAINKAMTIDRRIMKSSPDGVAALSQLGITNVLSALYEDVFYGDETLTENENFDLSDRYFEDEDEQLEAEKEVREYTAFCESLGKDVFLCMPELKPYYSERVIGHHFHERYQEGSDTDDWSQDDGIELNTEAERHLDFFISLLTDHLCVEFEEYLQGIAYRGVCWLLTAMTSKHIAMDHFKVGFCQLMSVYRMLNDDKNVFSSIEKYCNRLPVEPHEQYINYGSPYKPMYKKNIEKKPEALSDLLRMWRKLNANSGVVQPIKNRI